jgi:predicted nucleic acid-binding protein
MSAFLLDTNVLSETARRTPDSRVVAWIRTLPSLQFPSVVLYELASGVARLPAGKRRRFLDGWLAELLASDCTILSLDRDAALASAAVEATARLQRRKVEHRDLLILGTAKARGVGVATRNAGHFRGLGVPVYDPFADAYLL